MPRKLFFRPKTKTPTTVATSIDFYRRSDTTKIIRLNISCAAGPSLKTTHPRRLQPQLHQRATPLGSADVGDPPAAGINPKSPSGTLQIRVFSSLTVSFWRYFSQSSISSASPIAARLYFSLAKQQRTFDMLTEMLSSPARLLSAASATDDGIPASTIGLVALDARPKLIEIGLDAGATQAQS
jgi:hypothetical protein